MDIVFLRHYHPRSMLATVLAPALAAVLGLAIGLLLGRREAARLRATLDQHERALRETVVPSVEMRARELGVAFVSIPPPDMSTRGVPHPTRRGEPDLSATIQHLTNLCQGIADKEHVNSMALSDTVQMQKSDLGPIGRLKSK